LNGPVYAILADRIWQRSGDIEFLKSYYPSIKKNTIFTMAMNPAPEGPISMPADNAGMEWFEWGEWLGMCSHLGGIRLAALQIIARMAEAVGDSDFADQCRQWYASGSAAMEDKMWTGRYYLNFYEEKAGRKSDAIMGYQLDGEWIADCHGVPGAFRAERVPVVLETIRECNMPSVNFGALSFADPRGGPLSPDNKIVEYGSYFMFFPEVMMLAMNYIYNGQPDFGLEFLRKTMEVVVCREGHAWDTPNVVDGQTGERVFGTDYYQNMMLWALPSAVAGQDLKAACAPGSLVDRMIQAGR
jgi:uncharacterized protein (DUF608 family)